MLILTAASLDELCIKKINKKKILKRNMSACSATNEHLLKYSVYSALRLIGQASIRYEDFPVEYQRLVPFEQEVKWEVKSI